MTLSYKAVFGQYYIIKESQFDYGVYIKKSGFDYELSRIGDLYSFIDDSETITFNHTFADGDSHSYLPNDFRYAEIGSGYGDVFSYYIRYSSPQDYVGFSNYPLGFVWHIYGLPHTNMYPDFLSIPLYFSSVTNRWHVYNPDGHGFTEPSDLHINFDLWSTIKTETFLLPFICCKPDFNPILRLLNGK